MFADEDLIPISALQHLVFCERRAALVFIEGLWDENAFTVEGRHLHEQADEPGTQVRGEVRIARGLRLRSIRLGLSGKADVVEFHRLAQADASPVGHGDIPGVSLEGVSGLWRPFPVEYKRGRLRHERGYEVQLCAQAMCLEEMLGAAVPAGAIFYGKTVRRFEVVFDPKLRALITAGETPRARYEKKCESCSLIDLCLPKAMGPRRSVSRYLADAVFGMNDLE